jgi:cysteine desulfurase
MWLMSFLAKIFPKKRVFLDYASTTPIDREVSRAMSEVSMHYANPSALYSESIHAKKIINESKKKIASILDCQADNIYFTSGGTESNNIAILGIFSKYKTYNFTPHFITTNIEHPAILEVYKEIERLGAEVTYISVKENGAVNPKDIESAIKSNTVLVSVMYANNEIGTIQPIKEIGRVVREYRRKNDTNIPYFHSDACQASLYLSLSTLKLNLDLMTLDGIKMYGPRGAGILYVRGDVNISPIIFGGGQQSGLRSGTENIQSIVGLAKALEVSEDMKESESARLKILRDYAINRILAEFKNSSLNGDKVDRLPNNINICFPGIDSEFVTIALDVHGFSVSYSSSCRTLKEDSSSYVIESIGKETCRMSSLRFSLGRESKKSDIDLLIKALKKIIK